MGLEKGKRTCRSEDLGGLGQIVVQVVDASPGHLVVAESVQLLDVAIGAGHPNAHRLAADAEHAAQGTGPFRLWEP
jgi:hypothetical protein